MNCKHEFKEDEMFECGAVMVFAGKIGEIEEETRMICGKCGEVKYIKKEQGK